MEMNEKVKTASSHVLRAKVFVTIYQIWPNSPAGRSLVMTNCLSALTISYHYFKVQRESIIIKGFVHSNT